MIINIYAYSQRMHKCTCMHAHASAFYYVNQLLNACACVRIGVHFGVFFDSKRIINNSYGPLYAKIITLLIINTLMQAHASACKRMQAHAIKKENKEKECPVGRVFNTHILRR